MKTKESDRSWRRNSWSWRIKNPNRLETQKGKNRRSGLPFSGSDLGATALLKLHAGADAKVVLVFAVKERRQVINLDHADVDVIAGVNVKTPTEGHGKSRIGFAARRERVVKAHAHV